MATIGERIRDRKIFKIPCSLRAPKPADTPTAPITPPIKACEEEDGIPHIQVNKFHIMAPSKAAHIMEESIKSGDKTISPPIVLATPVDTKAPKKLRTAVIKIAFLGEIARVETEVAIALAVSWKPLM